MGQDLTQLLSDWPYDPDNTTRIITAEDGRSVLQVRLPLGLEQYELEGRPDGSQPMGKPTVVDIVEDQLAAYVQEHGADDGFLIDHEEAVLLQNEGVLFYYRYLLLFQMNDFSRVSRDTEHNLRLARLLEKYCENDSDRNAVLQFKPYIVRMNAMARAMMAVQNDMKETAAEVIDGAVEEIEQMADIDSPAFHFEKVRSVNYLRSALKQIHDKQPDPVKRLEEELERAVEDENYERAAELRDQIRNMR